MTKRNIIFPAISPSLAEFKSHIRITSAAMDGDLQSKLVAAIQSAEHVIGKVIAFSRFTYSGQFAQTITLEKRPFVGVCSVKVDGEATTNYTVTGRTLTFAEGVTGQTVLIIYEAGMCDVPYDIKAAILLHAAALFNNPVDSVETLPKASTNLLRPYRSWGLDDGE